MATVDMNTLRTVRYRDGSGKGVKSALHPWLLQGEYQDLIHSRQGYFDSLRNVAIYLIRRLRDDTLKKTGDHLREDNYSSVSTIIDRIKMLLAQDPVRRENVQKLASLIDKSQE